MDVNEIIKSEEDRAVLAELIAKIFGEDAEAGTVEMVIPGDVLTPLVKMYDLGFKHASKLSNKASQPLKCPNCEEMVEPVIIKRMCPECNYDKL